MNINKYYSQLIGGTIVGFKWYKDEYLLEPMPVFTLSIGGQKVELSLSMDEEGKDRYWIIPKKIDEETMQALLFLRKKAQGFEAQVVLENGDNADVIKDLKRSIMDDLLDSSFVSKEMMKLAIKGGVYDHNLDDKDGNKVDWNDALVDRLLGYNSDVAFELYGAIMKGINRPLAVTK